MTENAEATAGGESGALDSAADGETHPELPVDAAAGDLAVEEPPVVLVPLDVLEGETIPEALVEFLAPAEVVLLGYREIPEQTSTEQASMQFEERARAALEEIAASFEAAAGTVETRVVFTHDRDQTIERVAEDVGATATLLSNPAGEIAEVLVPVRGAIPVERLADLVATLVGGGTETVTLWGLAPPEGEYDAAADVTRVRETLLERGLPDGQLLTEVSESATPLRAIVERSAAFDAIVMGEGGATLWTALFGDAAEQVAEGAVAPVLVVRGEGDGEE